ncbi:MAG: NAD(P)H-dependent oxidoreductase [Paramuribaculum sp.]|nr:NAD(P)H-dependent oxidoreductase [Paramuribaculum sp.]
MITVIYCHPYPGSFNHSILQSVTDLLSARGDEYDVIDLYAEGFNPVLDRSGLALFSKGESDDEMVGRYQLALTRANSVIFIFPIWWGMMPAMLKGFIDKVFLKGTIYDDTPEGGMLPCLSIDKTTVVTTSQAPTAMIEPFIQGYFIPNVLNTVGINNVTWLNCDQVKTGTPQHRKEFMADVLEAIAK